MSNSLTIVGLALWTFPAAGLAWVAMWITERFYENTNIFLHIIATILRVFILLDQLGICLFLVIGCVAGIYFLYKLFHGIAKGYPSTIKRYLMILAIPVVMAIGILLVELVNMWLNFNDHGLGFIALGYKVLEWYLAIGSILVFIFWLIFFPIFLHARKRSSEILEFDP